MPAVAQSEWKLAPPGPGDRHHFAMVHDAARRQILLFGGNTSTGDQNDTWSYRAGAWTNHQPSNAPSIRAGHAMAYDALRARVVLFGGGHQLNYLNDTWEWDGRNWTQMAPATTPGPRYGASMAFDPVSRRVLLYGGSTLSVWYEDTWAWDGTNWTQVLAGGRRTSDPALVTDSSRGLVLLVDSWRPGYWEWTGSDWRLGSARMPLSRRGDAVAYDSARRRTVMFGGMFDGNGLVLTDETWEFDGATWVQRMPTARPPARFWHSMAYDPDAGEMLMAFGRTQPARMTDAWLYAPLHPAAHVKFGAGCRGSAGVPALDLRSGLPWLGDPILLEVANLPPKAGVALVFGGSNAQWGSVPLPFDLGWFGMPGCMLQSSIDFVLPATSTGGVAWLPLHLAGGPELRGLRVYHQAFVQDPAANPAGLTVSNGAVLQLGAR